MQSNYRILIVDDEVAMVGLVERLLHGEFLVTKAHSVAKGLEALNQNLPDILLTDIKMPGGDGLELLKTVQQSFPQILSIVVTGHADKNLAIEALRRGAFDMLEKPFKSTQLKSCLARAVQILSSRRMLIESSRLNNVGLMVASLAHSIRTPLTILSGHAQVLLESQNLSRDEKVRCEKQLQAVNKIDHMIEHVHAMSRDQRQPKIIEISSFIRDCCSFLETYTHKFQTSILIDEQGAKGVLILGHSGQLESALQNLLINACEAYEEKKIPSPRKVIVKVSSLENDLAIEVIDQAGGVDPEIIEKIFDPFFSTKTRARGGGLGLTFTRTTLQEHGGDIVASNNGAGTTFTLRLPKHQAEGDLADTVVRRAG